MTILLLLIIIGLLNSSNNRLNLKIKHLEAKEYAEQLESDCRA